MGMSPHEYYCMTRAEVILKIKGYSKKETMKSWHTREIIYATYATQFGRKKAMPSKHSFWPLPIDTEGDNKLSEDQMRDNWLILSGKKQSDE